MSRPLVALNQWCTRRRGLLLGLLASAAMAMGGTAMAQTMTPDALVHKVTEDVLSTVKSDPDIKSGNISKIQSLVESKVLPYVNFQKMTATAVGRNWSQATPEQQKDITDQFRQLLIYTYSGALKDVSDQKVEYLPFRADPADTQVQVNTRIVNPRGGEPIQLYYKLEKTGAEWKIIDVNVLGVWLVENYRNTFQQEISRGGIDGLIKSLTEKNKSRGAAVKR